jgi:hypothetical protein
MARFRGIEIAEILAWSEKGLQPTFEMAGNQFQDSSRFVV